MTIVYLLLPLALCLAGTFVAGYVWCAAKGQYEDLETPAHRILLDEENENIAPAPWMNCEAGAQPMDSRSSPETGDNDNVFQKTGESTL